MSHSSVACGDAWSRLTLLFAPTASGHPDFLMTYPILGSHLGLVDLVHSLTLASLQVFEPLGVKQERDLSALSKLCSWKQIFHRSVSKTVSTALMRSVMTPASNNTECVPRSSFRRLESLGESSNMNPCTYK